MANKSDTDFMRSLAVALVQQPRATLQELATLVGVSKATLYRFCRTRDELLARLMSHCLHIHRRILVESDINQAPVEQVLSHMINAHVAEKEFTTFLAAYWLTLENPEHPETSEWNECMDTIDGFFLRGQRDGVFRLDTPAVVLSDMFLATLGSLIEAERRGRVARMGLAETIERLFLSGSKEQSA